MRVIVTSRAEDTMGQRCYYSGMTNSALLQRGLWLEYATLAWNVIGTVIVLIAALRAGSAALAGFGLDSAIEIFASVVVVW